MFTGIVEGLGRIAAVRPGSGGGKTLEVEHGFSPNGVAVGDSVALNGVCLTATTVAHHRYTVDAGPETLDRTTVGQLAAGHRVNLERAATLSTRLGGHLVQGHVDAVGRIRSVEARQNAWDLWVELDPATLRLVVPRGSVTVDGISLTVTGRDATGFSISIIPHTWEVTALSDRTHGSSVNVEVDLIARYVDALLEPARPGLSFERLAELGYR